MPVQKALSPGQMKAKLWVCGDYSVKVNPLPETNGYLMPHPEDLMQKLSGGFCFTKIKQADMYTQIKLMLESYKRVTLELRTTLLQIVLQSI